MTGLGPPGGLDASCTKHALYALVEFNDRKRAHLTLIHGHFASLRGTAISPDAIDIPPLDGYSPA